MENVRWLFNLNERLQFLSTLFTWPNSLVYFGNVRLGFTFMIATILSTTFL